MSAATLEDGDSDTATSPAVAEVKKTDVVSSQKAPDIFEDGNSKKGGIEIVEFENGGGEIYVGEEENWVEKLKEFKGWNDCKDWQWDYGGISNQKVEEEGELEIVWQDDVFNLRNIKQVPKVDGKMPNQKK